MKNDYDPSLIEEAKRIARGPLGKVMAKFPLKFASCIIFGEKPTTAAATSSDKFLRSATAMLVNFGHGPRPNSDNMFPCFT